MRSQVGSVCKLFTTMSAAVWFLPGVRSHVTLQEPGTGESFVTNVALVGQVMGQNVHL